MISSDRYIRRRIPVSQLEHTLSASALLPITHVLALSALQQQKHTNFFASADLSRRGKSRTIISGKRPIPSSAKSFGLLIRDLLDLAPPPEAGMYGDFLRDGRESNSVVESADEIVSRRGGAPPPLLFRL